LHLIRFPLRCAAPARAAGQRAEAIWMGHSCVISRHQISWMEHTPGFAPSHLISC
jgi:hypothetical protein